MHGHSSDVLDLKWSPELYLITASIDNTAIIWGKYVDSKTKKTSCIIKIFKGNK